MSELVLRNRQRVRAVDLPWLRRIALALLADDLLQAEFQLGVHLIEAREMMRLNEEFLHHAGSTDVITFDYADHRSCLPPPAAAVHGEIFICVDEAVAQARRFQTSWQSEIVRYLVHGALHLRGHDDQSPTDRRSMKREENRLLRRLAHRFALSRLARRRKVAA